MTSKQQPESDLEQVSFYLGRAYYSYIGLLERLLAEMGMDDTLRPGMGNVLFALFEEDNVTLTEIARRLQVAKSTMTSVAARIKKAGLVTTHRDPDDGRAVRLRLTPLGRSLEPRCRELAQQIDATICAGLSQRQRDQLRRMLATDTATISDGLEKRQAASRELRLR